MRPGERLTLSCHDVDDEGAGLCAADDGGELHVPGALPGEALHAIVQHVSPHRPEAWGDLLTIDRASPDRQAPACAAYGTCGGCVLQHWAGDAQRAWKAGRVRAALAAHPSLVAVAVGATVASPRPLGYRNNAKLVCGRDGDGALVLGAYAPRTHDVVDLRGCRIVEPPLDDVTDGLRAVLEDAGAVPYDERQLSGDLRYAVLRANHAGQVLVTLVTARTAWPAGARVAADLRARLPAVGGVVQNLNPTRGNVIFGDREVTLAGAATLPEQIGGVRLRLSSRAFFQANRGVAALAYAAIAQAIGRGAGRVVDAYCGVGGIALTVAPAADEVIGIESSADAVADAQAAAADNDAGNARFIAADSAAGLRTLDRADAVVLNPPRKGCAPAVLTEVRRLSPRIIAYLSCAPATLARDLATLTAAGAYAVRSVTPYDMLPDTAHVEALAIVEALR